MSGLYGSLTVALSALRVEQGAMEAAANNVANVNTPGFSRLRPVIVPGEPVVVGSLSFGTGVVLERMQSLRDPILELRLHEETQQQGYTNALVDGMRQVEVMFSSTGSDLGSSITKFFNSLNQLSTDPGSTPLRQSVLTAAGNLTDAFRNGSKNLDTLKSNLDLDVQQTVDQVNVLTAQIAKLNAQIADLENVHEDASAFIDQQTQLIRNLSGLIDVSVVQTEQGLSLTTSGGTALVTSNRNFVLDSQLGVDGVHHVVASGADITTELSAGKLAGLIAVRDQKIPGLDADLDQLAVGLSTSLNAAHHAGFDVNGTPGGDFFVPPASSGAGAASTMAVAITDPDLLAASSDGSSGSNGNVIKLAAVHDQAIVSGQTPIDFFSHMTFQVGSDIANGQSELEASGIVLRQLEDQRASISGVSLDEEAANLVLYQRAYQAAARVITTVNEMLDTVMNLGR